MEIIAIWLNQFFFFLNQYNKKKIEARILI